MCVQKKGIVKIGIRTQIKLDIFDLKWRIFKNYVHGKLLQSVKIITYLRLVFLSVATEE